MLPPITPPALFQLRLLDNCYDGVIPAKLQDAAACEDYRLYTRLLTQAAERRFARRIHDNLQIIKAWRQRVHPYRWHRLRFCHDALTQYRHRAREAFDLSA